MMWLLWIQYVEYCNAFWRKGICMWDTLKWAPKPTRTAQTYKRMIALAIAERDLHTDLSPAFKLCIPLAYIKELALHFPNYSYAVIGGCFSDRDQVYVTWAPYAQRKNH
jgi:hypothetical protein